MAEMNISIFCGGRGSANIINALINQTDYKITLLVNAYDDGKSTGRLRDFIPGFLGPSDFRKNVSTILEAIGEKEIASFLEFRITKISEPISIVNYISENYRETLDKFSHLQYKVFSKALNSFEVFQKSSNIRFDFADCPIGNILIAGLYLYTNCNFNLAVKKYQELFLGLDFKVRILNVTDGDNLYLVAKSDSGVVFREEEVIVVNSASERIRQIALIPAKNRDLEDDIFTNPRKPKANPDCISALSESQFVIYGPGTQASSLLPTYLTENILKTIRENTQATKIFISNLVPDFDDPLADVRSRLDAFQYVANIVDGDFALENYITNVFSELPLDILGPLLSQSTYRNISFQTDNWLVDGGKHLGPAIVRQIASVSHKPFQFKPGFLSLLVRGIHDKHLQIDFLELIHGIALDLNLGCEVFFDLGKEHFQASENGVLMEVPAIQIPIEDAFLLSRGDIIAVLESPLAYTLADLKRGIRLLQESSVGLVLGSRNLRITNLKNQIALAYQGQPFRGFAAYWGSLVLSVSFLLKHNRFITDPLSGIKIFSRPQIDQRIGALFATDSHINILKYFLSQDLPILQYDVGFQADLLNAKNRHGILQGLKSLLRIWINRDLGVKNDSYSKSKISGSTT